MPAEFLSDEQAATYGRFTAPPSRAELERFFFLAHARAVAEAAGRHVGRPVAHPPAKVEHARLLHAQGDSLAVIATKTGIPKTSLHRYLNPAVDGPGTTVKR